MPNSQQSKAETAQQTIFGEAIDEQVSIETTGRIIRPFKRMLDQVADEYKLRFTEDGLSVRVVDPANVIMIENTLHASVFDEYNVEDTTLGINGSAFGSVLKHARYGASTDDPISLVADSRRLQSTVNRSVGEATATVTERADLIDPDSIRKEPDIPDLDFDTSVEIAPSTFIEAVRMMDDSSSPICFGATEDSITITQEGDIQQRSIELDCEPEGEPSESMYSPDYIHHFKNAFNNGYVDSLTMNWSTEFPLIVEFEREDIMSGRMMVAPRVRAESGEI